MNNYPYGYFHNSYRTTPNAENIQNGHSQNSGRQENGEPERAENNRARQQQTLEQTQMHPQYLTQPQNIHEQMLLVERQLARLINLIEENNQLLRSMQNQVVTTGGGGAVIVRM